MDSVPYEVQYINDEKRYGVFATQNIETGTAIYREVAAMVNIQVLSEITTFWEEINTTQVSLHPTTKLGLETQTRMILNAMQNLTKFVAGKQGYDTAMEIHKQRVNDNSIYETNQDTNVTQLHPRLSMELYKRTVNTAGHDSQEALPVLLHETLQQINTYLHGLVHIQYPENQAWGPITSLINHGCCPNAMVSCFSPPDPNPPTADMGHIGGITIRALTDIREGQEISIEYIPVFGTGVYRSQQLRIVGISHCLCETCDIEKELIRRADEDEAMKATYRSYEITSTTLAIFFINTIYYIENETPAAFYQGIHTVITDLFKVNYHGFVFIKLYDTVIHYAIRFNDNVRIYWFTTQLLDYLAAAYGASHHIYENYRLRFLEPSLSGNIWNEDQRDKLTLVHPWTEDEDIIRLMFMLYQPHTSPNYHLISISPTTGRLEPVSHEENLLRVHHALANPGTPTSSTICASDNEDEEEATAAANLAAAALAAEVEAEATKTAKAKAKKKAKLQRQREKKRAAAVVAAAAIAAEEEEKEKRLAERVAAVRAAVVVPALPLLPVRVRVRGGVSAVAAPAAVGLAPVPVVVAPPAPSPSPPPRHHHRFRSSSNPEAATVARFFAGVPLRPPPEDFEDTVSESGVALRFGVRL